ncbi:MAG: DsrE family protein [Candidatus Lokiarchaeota archaeon]|nr:DsrE family protein [Candidatus Lokiarchaeota archaeon]
MAENNSIVYLYGFSTMIESKLINLIKIVEHQLAQKHQISVVFIHDGVIGTSKKHKITPTMKMLLNLPIIIYSLLSDLKARGIDAINLQNNVKGIDYEDLVDILINKSKIVSWM